MMKIALIFTFFLLYTLNAHPHQGYIRFASKGNYEVQLYCPLDGGYNDKICTKKLVIHEDTVTFEVPINNYTYILCRMPQVQYYYDFVLFPNDSILVHIEPTGLFFQGSNADAHQFVFNKFYKEPTLKRYLAMRKLFLSYEKKEIKTEDILPSVNNVLGLEELFCQMDRLSTSQFFSSVIKQEAYMNIYSDIIELFQIQLSKVSNYQERMEICHEIDKIYQKVPITSATVKYPSCILYLSKYLRQKYGDYSCPVGYDNSICGVYSFYLYLHKSMQSALLGHACLVQLQYDTDEMNLEKFQRFFIENYPHSEYVPIINERINEQMAVEKILQAFIGSMNQ